MKFWNFKYENNWHEVTTSQNITKPILLQKLKRKGLNLKSKEVWMSINAPNDCPLIFEKSLYHFN